MRMTSDRVREIAQRDHAAHCRSCGVTSGIAHDLLEVREERAAQRACAHRDVTDAQYREAVEARASLDVVLLAAAGGGA